MAVYSDTFGGLRLTGEDAKKFRNQVHYGNANKAAKQSAAQGRALVQTFLKTGSVTIDITKD